MNFEDAHESFIRHHLAQRSGERKGRLERGHREAEKLFCGNVWWRVAGRFDQLHPEFEVLDWRGHSYFCDFVWITPYVKLVIEIKGFGSHVKEMDRQKYCNELNRETFLTAMGFQVISFAYDDVALRPELCINLLRMVMSRFQATTDPIGMTTLAEKELVRLSCALGGMLRPLDVEKHLGLNHRTAVKTLRILCVKGLASPVAGAEGKHIVRYTLLPGALRLL
ncbi:DUF559 domain-containing protein [Cohnella soli]|uniref:DUF559 domain-containing protein n=1 Tax=Cohnella soli TaxID=425005 RepID=A0ABW0HY88_9BACL